MAYVCTLVILLEFLIRGNSFWPITDTSAKPMFIKTIESFPDSFLGPWLARAAAATAAAAAAADAAAAAVDAAVVAAAGREALEL